MTSGRFITFEGGEGAGKSTQITGLKARLEVAQIPLLTTREPGGSPLGEGIRGMLLDPNAEERSALTETLLFCAARSDHVARVIAPALAAGTWVLSDRFADSTRAYQGAADGVSADVLNILERTVLQGVNPDLTILLDLPAEEGLRRAYVRANETGSDGAQDRFELRDREFHERLRQGFLDIAAAAPERVIVIDAMQDKNAITEEIWQVVSARLGVTS